MNTQDQSQFKELLLTISEVYNHVFTEAQTKIWWNIFKPYSLEEFKKGVYAYLSCPNQGMFNPKPASIIKMIVGTEKACDDEIHIDGVYAWYHLIDHVKDRCSKPEYIENIIDLIGGVSELKKLTVYEMNFKRKEFLANYTAMKRIEHKKDQERRLALALNPKAISHD